MRPAASEPRCATAAGTFATARPGRRLTIWTNCQLRPEESPVSGRSPSAPCRRPDFASSTCRRPQIHGTRWARTFGAPAFPFSLRLPTREESSCGQSQGACSAKASRWQLVYVVCMSQPSSCASRALNDPNRQCRSDDAESAETGCSDVRAHHWRHLGLHSLHVCDEQGRGGGEIWIARARLGVKVSPTKPGNAGLRIRATRPSRVPGAAPPNRNAPGGRSRRPPSRRRDRSRSSRMPDYAAAPIR